MKALKWTAIVLGVLALAAFLSPLAVRVDSEGAYWLAYFVLVLAWYLVGPLLIIMTTIMAAAASVLSVRDPDQRRNHPRTVGWCWVAVFAIEAAVALSLLSFPHAIPEPGPAIVMGSVVAVTGICALVVVLQARAQVSGAPALKRSHLVLGIIVPLVVLIAVLLVALYWALAPTALPVGSR